MRVRLEGSKDECATMVAGLRDTFAVGEVSGFCPNRGEAEVGRVYVQARPVTFGGYADRFVADTVSRCLSARKHHGGHPNGAWSTGEQLAVALVLHDRDHLEDMGYSVAEATARVAGGICLETDEMGSWLRHVRIKLAVAE